MRGFVLDALPVLSSQQKLDPVGFARASEEKPMPQAPALRDTGQSSNVAKLVTLHHRRRGWAWAGAGSAVGLAVYAGIDASSFEHVAGAAATLSVIPVLVLVGLVVAGLVVVIVDTARLHRADAAVRVQAKGSVSHHPLYAQPYRWPPRHPGSWVAIIFLLTAMTCITAYILPQEVNAFAYVAGAEHQDTFNPVSYSHCPMVYGRGCHVVTEGYLSRTGEQVSWASQAPLGQPFGVRDPLWAWGTGRKLIGGDGSAIPYIVAGLFLDAVALLLLFVIVVIVRETSPGRSQPTPAPAGTGPGAVRRTPHPDRGHHGHGGRRYARRGRRKR
jgi:hypothetical protein